MNQDQTVLNKFESYTATRDFALGSTGINIPRGSEVFFDQTVVIYNEARYTMPTLRGAVRLRWLVLTSEYNPDLAASSPVSANIGLRPPVTNSQSLTQTPTKTAAVTVQSDERVVMTRGDHTTNVQQRTAAARGMPAPRGNSSSRGNGYDVEPQEARAVARAFKTPARVSTDMAFAGAAISQAQAVEIEPGQGISESEYLERLSPEEAEKYLSEKEARKAIHAVDLARHGLPTTSPTVVGHVRKISSSSTSEGIRSTVTTSGGTEVYDASTGDAKPALSTVSAEGLTFSNTNGPKRAFQASTVSKEGVTDARRIIAKAICADFPDNYSFDDHWKRRLARIQLDFSDRPDVIRAIFAAETDDFKKVILEEFPEAFKS